MWCPVAALRLNFLRLTFYSCLRVNKSGFYFVMVHHYKNSLLSLHTFIHHCTFCASLHVKTSPEERARERKKEREKGKKKGKKGKGKKEKEIGKKKGKKKGSRVAPRSRTE